MATNELLNTYCTNLYRIGNYAFTDKEDAQKYLEVHIKWELKGWSHGVIHIPLADAESGRYSSPSSFVNKMDLLAGYVISYDKDEFNSVSQAFNNGDPTISDEDAEQINEWETQYWELEDAIEEVLNSTNVEIDYDEEEFVITGTKSEVEQLFQAMNSAGGNGWVEQESLTYIDEIDEDDFEDPGDLDIDYKGDYFLLQ